MNRRQFFTVTSCLAVTGCGRTGSGVVLTADEQARIAVSQLARKAHFEELSMFRVEAGATRTTPKPPVDVTASLPDLKGLSKVAVRLHPRYGDEPKPDESKLSGQFLWPADEPWPTDTAGTPLVPVLQLRSEDAPPNCPFQLGTDLLQLLWSPRVELKPVIAWRKRSAVTGDLAPYPDTSRANMDFVPLPCRVFPERVTEYPPYEILPAAVKVKIDGSDKLPRRLYDAQHSVADGTKVGGYAAQHRSEPPACPSCGWGMEFLLCIVGREWSNEGKTRWQPIEENSKTNDVGFRSAAGLNFGKERDSVLIYVCRRCEHWPIGMKIV